MHCAAGSAPGFDFSDPVPLLEAMDLAGVDHAVLGPIGRWAAVEHEAGNRELAAWCARWPDRFSRWVTVNPWYADAATRLAVMLGDDDVVGIKLAPAIQGFSLLLPALLDSVLDVAEGAGVPVYVVTGVPVASEPFQLAELARRTPGVRFVMGRSGRTDFSLDLVPALEAVPNLVAETAYNGAALIADLVARLGGSRVVFASDAPANEVDLELARVHRAGLSEVDRCAVLGGSARTLMERAA